MVTVGTIENEVINGFVFELQDGDELMRYADNGTLVSLGGYTIPELRTLIRLETLRN